MWNVDARCIVTLGLAAHAFPRQLRNAHPFPRAVVQTIIIIIDVAQRYVINVSILLSYNT